MAQKYTKVLELMQSKGGRLELTDPDLDNVLGRLKYRIATYIWQIRRFAKLEVKGVRDSRKVVAYELVALSNATQDATATVASESPAATV